MGDDPATPVAMIAIIAAHLWVAVSLHRWAPAVQAVVLTTTAVAEGGSTKWLAWAVECGVVWAAAALFGGFCAFGFQALDHELSHASGNAPWLAHSLGLMGSGCTLVPWFSYYFSGGHARHHRLAGSPQDIDREAFFWAWERVPAWLPDTPAGSVVWASVVGLGLPVMYVASLAVCLLGNWRQNVTELGYFAADSAATLLVHGVAARLGGGAALGYLVLSMAFGNGFLMHPLIGFWLMQHHCAAKDAASGAGAWDTENKLGGAVSLQPTLSYTGPWVWNLLNFNQLSHTEHHDFARVSWRKAPRLRLMCPEFYDEAPGLERVPSLAAFLRAWVVKPGDKMNFACIGAAAPPVPPLGDAKEPAAKKVE